MEYRRLGRLGRMNSVLIYGGAALSRVDPDEADRSIALALESGVNHFDTAPDYGDSELHYGRWMPEIRDRIFLSTKIEARDRDGAWRDIHASLDRLRTDRIDLIQLHAVGDPEDLDRVTGSGGALEAAVEAREQGIVGAIGITGHGNGAPATHREALRRFPFETVLTPWNYILSTDESFRHDFEALVSEARRQDAALMTIKTISRRNWRSDHPLEGQRYSTWYEPFDEQCHVDAAVSWSLSHEEIAGIAMVGDVRLVPKMIAAERNRMSRMDAEDVLLRAPDYSSPFIEMPI